MNKKVYYLHGHPQEIANMLTDMSSANNFAFRKYPLIALLQDFNETVKLSDTYYNISSITFLLVTSTKKEYSAAQRYEKVFKPTLYPLLQSFLEVIEWSPNLSPIGRDELNWVKTDRVYWGKVGINGNEGMKFNDTLDCIELRFDNLKIKKYC